MPQRKRYETPGETRYLTFSCYRQLPLFGTDAIKGVFVDALRRTRDDLGFDLLAWVVMPEHVHLLLTPDLPEAPVSKVLQSLKQRVAKRVVARWVELDAPVLARIMDSNGVRRFWQRGGGYDRNLISEAQVREKARYIHLNPVRRGLVSAQTDWTWSSARYYEGLTPTIC